VIAGVALLLAAACGGDSEGPEPTGTSAATPTSAAATPTGTVTTPPSGEPNLLVNPGLEDGLDPWFSLGPEAAEIGDVAHSGQRGVLLSLGEPPDTGPSGIRTLGQDLGPGQFPEMFSGYYRVENWQRGASKQYLELVVVAFNPTNLTIEFPNHQIHYLLAGIDQEPGEVLNAHFVFLSREDPRQDEWVYFQADVGDDFEQLWGAIPEGYSSLRVLFRVVYEDRVGEEPVEADVYFDDLYFGSASANPNQPGTS
jgi:hypothetical protein